VNHVRVDEIDNAVQPAAVMRRLTDALGCSELAINYYELAPGDSFAFAFHEHTVQEEVFVVLSGAATWTVESTDSAAVSTATDTERPPSEVGGTARVEVEGGEVVRFPPGERQRGWNRSDERLRALAIGAPLTYGDQPKTAVCPACGEAPVSIGRPDDDREAVVTTCDDCGREVGRWVRGDDGENERVRGGRSDGE
jgi:uncharacterized cupin superfamily protein